MPRINGNDYVALGRLLNTLFNGRDRLQSLVVVQIQNQPVSRLLVRLQRKTPRIDLGTDLHNNAQIITLTHTRAHQ